VDSTPSRADSLTIQEISIVPIFGETLTVPSLSAPYSRTFPNAGKYSGGNIWATGIMPFRGLRRPCSVLRRYQHSRQFTFYGPRSVYDIDFQHDVHLGESQDFVWGLGYRSIQDTNGSSFTVSLQPNHSRLNQYSGFVQDEVSLFDKRLRVTLAPSSSITISQGLKWNPTLGSWVFLSKKPIGLGCHLARRQDPCVNRRGSSVE